MARILYGSFSRQIACVFLMITCRWNGVDQTCGTIFSSVQNLELVQKFSSKPDNSSSKFQFKNSESCKLNLKSDFSSQFFKWFPFIFRHETKKCSPKQIHNIVHFIWFLTNSSWILEQIQKIVSGSLRSPLQLSLIVNFIGFSRALLIGDVVCPFYHWGTSTGSSWECN